MLAFHGEEGNFRAAHGGFHVRPGCVSALGEDIRASVEIFVKNGQTEIGKADVVNVGEGEGNAGFHCVPVFDDLVDLPADIAAGFLDGKKDALETIRDFLVG